MKLSKINKVKPMKNWLMVIILFYVSSLVIKGARTKWSIIFFKCVLKVQSCKLYNSKYMITSTQIANIEIFAFIAVLVFKLVNHKVLFINRKGNIKQLRKYKTVKKLATFKENRKFYQ